MSALTSSSVQEEILLANLQDLAFVKLFFATANSHCLPYFVNKPHLV